MIFPLRKLIVGISLLALPLQAKTFHLAGLYSTGVMNLSICTYGLEMSCITNALVEDARKEGMDITYEDIDPHWSPIETALAAKKIVSEKKFDAVVGTIVSQEALSASKVLGDGGIPFISPAGTHPDITKNNPLVLRVPFDDIQQASLLAKLTANELRPKKIAIVINTSNTYSDFISKEYRKELARQGSAIPIVEFEILDDFSDFDGLVRKIMASGADLVFAPLWEEQVASIYPRLASKKTAMTLLAGDTIDGRPAFLKLLGPLSPQIQFIFSSYWNGKLSGPYADKFRKLHASYCAKYPISRVSVTAFDAANLVIQALKKGPIGSHAELVRRMKALKLDGLTGRLVYDESNTPHKPISLFKVEGSSPVFWKEYR